MKKKAKYITFEGGDGSGKTTTINLLLKFLESKNKKVLHTKEFGSTHDKACMKLREIALNSSYNMDEIAAQLVFAAMIRQHHQKVLVPLQKEYNIIVSDRGIDSNYAYGLAHGLTKKQVDAIFKLPYEEGLVPDLTIYLDVDPLETFNRRLKRTKEKFSDGGEDRVEKKGNMLQSNVRKNFKLLAKKHDRIVIVEVGQKKPEEVLEEVIKVLRTRNIL